MEESLFDLQTALNTLLESRKATQDMILLNAQNSELKSLKIEIDMAVERTEAQIELKLRRNSKASWCRGDVCEVLWDNHRWYPALIKYLPIPPSEMWSIELRGFLLSASLPIEKIRRFEVPKWQPNESCQVYYALSRGHTSKEESANGKYIPAVIDNVVDDGKYVWVVFPDKGNENKILPDAIKGTTQKVSIESVVNRNLEVPKTLRSMLTGEELEARRINVENKRKLKKRERYRVKQEIRSQDRIERQTEWKEHVRQRMYRPF